MNDLSSRFTSADISDLPQITSYADDRTRVLWVLWIGKVRVDTPWLTPGQISEILRDVFGIHIPRQRIPGLIAPPLVARKRINGLQAYQLMQDGLRELESVPDTVTFIEPSQALSRIREVESLLAECDGVVSICDPYVDGRTLDFLANCRSVSEILLLTMNINKPAPFRRDLQAFRQEHSTIPIEVRTGPQGVLHDRYLVDDKRMLIFGTSLNSLGKKQSFVIAAGEDLRRVVLAEFQRVWQQSTVWT